MTRHGRAVTIVVHRDGVLASRSVRVPLWLMRLAAVTGIVLTVAIVLGAVLYGPLVRTAARVPGLNRKIERLSNENAKVNALAAELKQMEANYEHIRTMLGDDIVPTRARASASTPIVIPIMARPPNSVDRYESEPSVPRHWPLAERGIITRGTVKGGAGAEPHSGIDIAIPAGTPIRASGGGTVTSAGIDPVFGLYVRLAHPEGFESMYGHASRILVAIGDTVQSGEVIGLSGSTGRSTAPHLHFEILRDGRSIDPLSLVQEGS